MHINEQALHSSVQQLRQAPYEADLVRAMQRIVASVHQLFGYRGAGVMFIADSQRLAYVAASDDGARALEEAQEAAGSGPCYESYIYASPVTAKDLHTDARWPALPARLPGHVRAVAGVPVPLGGSPVGALNVYCDQPEEWDSSDIQALRAYADLIEEILAASLAARQQGALADQLRFVLEYRVVIERAIGYLMAAHRLDAVTAFNTLRKRSRDTHRRVADIAAEILGGTQSQPQSRGEPS
ncbi:MAG TPA: GAF and ANTAR domain-containing protein [Streptosporangiaceae bacterium]|nr:GAF and ANTAR domain-containing protein [Streptosporangiaceae bacterium]